MSGLTRYNRSMLPSIFKDVFGEDFPSLMWDEEKGYRWAPSVDVYEQDAVLHFEVELPGIAKSDIQVEFNDGVLTIAGERKLEDEKSRGSYFSRERARGAFSRSFRIGEAYDPRKIKAEHKDGVLHVTIAKREESKPVSIKVS